MNEKKQVAPTVIQTCIDLSNMTGMDVSEAYALVTQAATVRRAND